MSESKKNIVCDAPIPTLSLFSGAGGLDIGFLQAGFDIRACVEIEPSYVKTLRANAAKGHFFRTGAKIFCEDIRKFDPTPFVDQGIRCVIGGPPCQTFSAAGRRAGGVIGVDDLRGQLFRVYCDILEKIKPEVFVFENVYGLPGANGGGPWREIVKAFGDAGYQLRAEVIDTADYGVPQHRERLIMIGFKTGDFIFPLPTHGPDGDGSHPLVSVDDAIADLQDDGDPYQNTLGGLYGHLLPEVPEGLNYSYFTAEMGHPRPVFAWRSKFHDLLYKVKRDEPCRTIKAQPGKFTGPFHWKNRHFTAAELKRLQTFPDDYDIIGSYGKVVEQIGNSVPPRLGYVIAKSVREQLCEPRTALEFAVRPPGFVSTFRQRQRDRSKIFKEIAKKANASAHRHPKDASAPASSPHAQRYSVSPVTLFDRRKRAYGTPCGAAPSRYDITVAEDGPHIDIQIVKHHGAASAHVPGVSAIEISGLKKYLPQFDSCSVLANVDELDDVIHCWNAVEDALIDRSRFFTLIDIYGHYANKGDDVSVVSRWCLSSNPTAVGVLNRFGSTSTCGDFIDKRALASELGLGLETLDSCITELRSHRFDIRTSVTHPIIDEDHVLCTYPFPLLSPRALVTSKAQIVRSKIQDVLETMVAYG